MAPSPSSSSDETFMREALALAAKAQGATSPNPMVGAVIVKGGKVVGRGFHPRAGEPHAEVFALREAGDAARGSTVFVSLEPCSHHGKTPPCADALIKAGVKRVVAAMVDPNPKVKGAGIAKLRGAGIAVETGLLQADARELNEFFVVFHELGRPFITIKWAMTLDGRTGDDSNHSKWISSESSRRHVHEIRARHDAILIGIGTVLADDPMLNVRIEGYVGRQPARIVIDGDLSIPRRARMLRERHAGPVILVTTERAPKAARKALEEDGHRVAVLPGKRRLIDVKQLMTFLAKEGIQSVLAEGGRQIHTSLLREGLADKIYAYVSPKIIGGVELRNPVEGLGLPGMEQAMKLQRVKWTQHEDDICLEARLREI